MTLDDLAPPVLPRKFLSVDPAWVELNGHMNVANYQLVFNLAGDAALDAWGYPSNIRQRGLAPLFVLQLHISHHRELLAGDQIVVDSRLVGLDAKHIHLLHEMFNAETMVRAADCETLLVHVGMEEGTPRALPMPKDVYAALAQVLKLHAPYVDERSIGRSIRPLCTA